MRKNSVFVGLLFVLVAFLYAGCEETNSLGFPVGEKKIQTIFLDTFTVKTSTILLDSISTSATRRILVGEYSDATFGKTKSSSYFQVGSQNTLSWTPQPAAVFDSVTLILKYDKYFYGDTTQVQNLVVNELSESIVYRTSSASENYSYFFSGGLFNHSEIKAFPSPIGSINYKPNPMSGNKIAIRLADQKGKDWLAIAQGENKTQIFSANFLDIFKGIKLSTPSTNGAVVGFVADSTVMRIYYSESDAYGTLAQKHFDFKLYNPGLQFNQINSDKTGTPLQNLVIRSAVPSEQTNNETFVQGGAGILTKIEFPNFKYLTSNNQKFMILSAQLVVTPINPLDGKKKLPANLGLLLVNKANIPTNTMAADFDQTKIQNSLLRYSQGNTLVTGEDREFNRSTQYTFSITQYMDALINGQPDLSSSLLLVTPINDFIGSVTQLRIGNGTNQSSKVTLQIYLSRLN
ncbi:MAG TPA: DUF4270 family protein [Cyclobacteriaceae bacterium]|jgi:hypothetical protein|nr:DUF4270 family protein [Cyclobacteriaceae bacterium]